MANWVSTMNATVDLVWVTIIKATESMVAQADKHRQAVPVVIGLYIWLFTKYLWFPINLSQKLAS